MTSVNALAFSVSLISTDSLAAKPASKSSHALAAASTSSSPRATPHAIYDGGYENASKRGVCIRIANGSAGQVGLICAWAHNFIRYMVEEKGDDPFQVAWYLGDSTESLALLSAGEVDMALTYIPAAETLLMESGEAKERIYVYMDKFGLVGPISNPANLDESDSIHTMFHKISKCGDADVQCPPDPDVRPACRFLSRCDKSATNLKESQIWLSIGSVPWGYDYSTWYHQYVRFPCEALRAASALSEYTLIDYGAWLSAPPSVAANTKMYKLGSHDEGGVLLNPAHLLYSSKVPQDHEALCQEFCRWVLDPEGGLGVTLAFEKRGAKLFAKAS